MNTKEKKTDTLLLFLIICLLLYSLLAIYSGSGQYVSDNNSYFVVRQLIWYGVGFAIMYAVMKFDYELLFHLSLPLYISGVVLLIIVHFFGLEKNGSQRWINLGLIEIQPSEFVKIFLVIYLAAVLSKLGDVKLSFRKSIPVLGKMAIISIIPFAFILVQPDLGSALVIVGISLCLFVVSAINFKMIWFVLSSLASLAATLIYLFQFQHDIFTRLLQPHQLSRIYGWLQPSEHASTYGYQLQQALMGIGSGQLTGKGFDNGELVQSGRVPEAHTDFIFAVIGEEFGFIGASLLIFIYFLFIYRIIQISLESNQVFGSYICVGIAGLLGIQVFQNIGMTIGLVPITGLPLPFVSYGGSALLTNFIALGLVFSIQKRSKKYMFSDDS